jgi:hypothetical protein
MGFGAHSHDEDYPDDAWSLYQHVDFQASAALNTTLGGACAGDIASRAHVAAVLRPHERRLERRPWLASDADEELLLVLKFTSPVHIRRILVIGGGGEGEEAGAEELAAHPSHLRCFVNRGENFDFASLNDVEPTQEFDLAVNASCSNEFLTRISAFTNVTTLALYFPANHGDTPSTLLRYVGLQGEHTHHQRVAVHTEYETLSVGDEGHGHSHGHSHGHALGHGHSHGH